MLSKGQIADEDEEVSYIWVGRISLQYNLLTLEDIYVQIVVQRKCESYCEYNRKL